jgi:hypothetical protein
VETDDKGVEHRYVAWGNTRYCIAELGEDMMSIKDRNGDGKITEATADDRKKGIDGDILEVTFTGMSHQPGDEQADYFTEAPWIYRRQDENGHYYGQYYIFYAMNWREKMAYATTDDLMSRTYQFGGLLMDPTATSNTNHMAVIDFKGKTYFIHHNGSKPWGSGFRRVMCIQEMKFNDDGSIDYIEETSTGLNGQASTITDEAGASIAHKAFRNSTHDSDYPYKNVEVGLSRSAAPDDALWQVTFGKADPDNKAFVSIESYNKPGLFLQAESDKTVTMGQDYQKATADGYTSDSRRMTFKTLKGFDRDKEGSVTFESVRYPGFYLTSKDGSLVLTSNPDASDCSFMVSTGFEKEVVRKIDSVSVKKTTRFYRVGDKLRTDDLRMSLNMEDGGVRVIRRNLTVDASAVDMFRAGTYELKVSCKDGAETYKGCVTITVR